MADIAELLASRDYRATIESNIVTPSIESIDYRNYKTNPRSDFPHVYKPVQTLTTEQADTIMLQVVDLIDSPSYRPFFFKKLYSVGPAAFIQVADHARKYGKQPSRLFVKLLKETTT